MASALSLRAETIFHEDLPDEFGWVEWLAKDHLRMFAGELMEALRQTAGDEAIEALLDSWRATAELDNAPGIREAIERNRSGQFERVDAWLAKQHATG